MLWGESEVLAGDSSGERSEQQQQLLENCTLRALPICLALAEQFVGEHDVHAYSTDDKAQAQNSCSYHTAGDPELGSGLLLDPESIPLLLHQPSCFD